MGAAIVAIICFFVVENSRKRISEDGFRSGKDKGFAEGVIYGRDEQKKYDDSICLEAQKKLMSSKKAETKTQRSNPSPVRYDINYKMNGNEVGEEIK